MGIVSEEGAESCRLSMAVKSGHNPDVKAAHANLQKLKSPPRFPRVDTGKVPSRGTAREKPCGTRSARDGDVKFRIFIQLFSGIYSGQFLNRQPHHRRNPRGESRGMFKKIADVFQPVAIKAGRIVGRAHRRVGARQKV